MSYCRICQQPRPCACTPYNALRERGEPGRQGDNAVIPTFTVSLTEGPVDVVIGGSAEAPTIEFFQPAPDNDLDYTWFGINTFTGPTEFQGSLNVIVGDGVDEGLFLPGSTVTTALIVTGTTTLGGNINFTGVTYTVDSISADGSAYFSGSTTLPNLTVTGNFFLSGTGTFPAFDLPNIQAYQRELDPTFTNIVYPSLFDDCGAFRQGVGIVNEPVKVGVDFLPAWASPIDGDGVENPIGVGTFNVNAPVCGPSQTGVADITAYLDISFLADITASSLWTIRMRSGSFLGTILDSFQFYTFNIGEGTFPNLRIPLRNASVPIVTGGNLLYFTVQSTDVGVSPLPVFMATSSVVVQ